MYPRMCVYHKISVYSAKKKKKISIWINPYSSDNLFIYFGPEKAKGKYTILFIYLFIFLLW